MAEDKRKKERIEFDNAINDSIPNEYKKEDLLDKDRINYYKDTYADVIANYFKEKNVKSLEVKKNRYGVISICSFSSSGRLCYLYFKNNENVEFEKPLKNDINSTTKMDAVVGNTFYECKCQEIIDRSHSYLSERYLESTLYNELVKDTRPQNGKTKIIYYKDKKGKKKEKKVIDFIPSMLGINDTFKKNVFDYKQLVCHLIAIANNTDDSILKVLNYVIFKPNDDVINENEYRNIKDTYDELIKVKDIIIEAVNNQNTPIGKYCSKDNHNIEIKIDIIELKEIYDRNNEKSPK